MDNMKKLIQEAKRTGKIPEGILDTEEGRKAIQEDISNSIGEMEEFVRVEVAMLVAKGMMGEIQKGQASPGDLMKVLAKVHSLAELVRTFKGFVDSDDD